MQLLQDFRIIRKHRVHVPAEQRRYGRGTARIRHVDNINVRHALKLLEADVLPSRGSDSRESKWSMLGMRSSDEVGKRVIGRFAVDDDHLRRTQEIADRFVTR